MRNKDTRLTIRVLALLLLGLALAGCRPQTGQTTTGGVSSTIQNKGSDTIVNLALAWAERYQTLEPDVRIAVTGGGSGTGIAALINGTVDLANASR
ncbi:MAG: substrate-binding domain-containing protein, partial [Caldilinea sp.]